MQYNGLDPVNFTDGEILSVSPEGISWTGGFLSFSECAENYKKANGGDGKCVGERYADPTPPKYVFYTSPEVTQVLFSKQGKFGFFFSKRKAYQRFYALQKQIDRFGYRTMDMS